MGSTHTQDQLQERPSKARATGPRNSLSLASASALLYRGIWNLQPLLQSLTRSKMLKLYHSYDEKAVKQHRLNGQYKDSSEAKIHWPNHGVSSSTAGAKEPGWPASAALQPALPPARVTVTASCQSRQHQNRSHKELTSTLGKVADPRAIALFVKPILTFTCMARHGGNGQRYFVKCSVK